MEQQYFSVLFLSLESNLLYSLANAGLLLNKVVIIPAVKTPFASKSFIVFTFNKPFSATSFKCGLNVEKFFNT